MKAIIEKGGSGNVNTKCSKREEDRKNIKQKKLEVV